MQRYKGVSFGFSITIENLQYDVESQALQKYNGAPRRSHTSSLHFSNFAHSGTLIYKNSSTTASRYRDSYAACLAVQNSDLSRLLRLGKTEEHTCTLFSLLGKDSIGKSCCCKVILLAIFLLPRGRKGTHSMDESGV